MQESHKNNNKPYHFVYVDRNWAVEIMCHSILAITIIGFIWALLKELKLSIFMEYTFT
jgi:hypothetical protein